MLILCAGMIRSASTLQYQLVSAVLKEAGIKFTSQFCGNPSELKSFSSGRGENEYRIAKLHFSFDESPDFLGQSDVRCFYVHRDILDVSASLMRKTGKDLEVIENEIITALKTRSFYLDHSDVVTVGYGDVVDDIDSWVKRICDVLSLNLSAKKIKKIADNHSLKKQKKRISGQKLVKHPIGKNEVWSMGVDDYGDNYVLLNPKTLLHKNHITSNGKSGGWEKELTPKDVLRITDLKIKAAIEAEQVKSADTLERAIAAENAEKALRAECCEEQTAHETLREELRREQAAYAETRKELENEQAVHLDVRELLREEVTQKECLFKELKSVQAKSSLLDSELKEAQKLQRATRDELEAEREAHTAVLDALTQEYLQLKEKDAQAVLARKIESREMIDQLQSSQKGRSLLESQFQEINKKYLLVASQVEELAAEKDSLLKEVEYRTAKNDKSEAVAVYYNVNANHLERAKAVAEENVKKWKSKCLILSAQIDNVRDLLDSLRAQNAADHEIWEQNEANLLKENKRLRYDLERLEAHVDVQSHLISEYQNQSFSDFLFKRLIEKPIKIPVYNQQLLSEEPSLVPFSFFPEKKLTEIVPDLNWNGLGWESLYGKLTGSNPLRVVFLNDMGFQYGAGIAERRQVHSFLKHGHQVACVSWHSDAFDTKSIEMFCKAYPNQWLGAEAFPYFSPVYGESSITAADKICEVVKRYTPDVVIAGNFHAAGWDTHLFKVLQGENIPVIAYLHDCFWSSGQCAYPGDCVEYLNGCTEKKCLISKKSNDYLPLINDTLEGEWAARRYVFASKDSIPMVANSSWTKKFFDRAFKYRANVGLVPLGVDTNIFFRKDKASCRREFNLSQDKFLICFGAVNLSEKRKNSRLLRTVVDYFKNRSEIQFVSFGHNSETEGVQSVGYINEGQVSSLFSACDLFLNLVTEEAFGMTMMEASACGCPFITYDVGGITDIAQHNGNAFIVEQENLSQIVDYIEILIKNSGKHEEMALFGECFVREHFSLDSQFNAWRDYLTVQALNHSNKNEAKQFYLENISQRKFSEGIPLVSVITASYNAAKDIRRTVESVLQQDYENIEFLIVDGVSTDNTLDIIAEYNDPRIQVHSEEDEGVYDALNKGAQWATGEYIVYMGAGDIFVGRDSISRVFSTAPDGVDIIYGNHYYQAVSGERQLFIPEDIDNSINSFVLGEISDGWLGKMPCHQTVYARRNLITSLKFDTLIRVSADWDMLLRAWFQGATWYHSNEVCAVYEAGGFSAQNASQWIEDVISFVNRYTTANQSQAVEYLRSVQKNYE